VTRARVGRAALIVAAVAVVVAGCVPSPGTDQGRSMAELWGVFLWAGLGVGGLVWVLATWALLRYRRSPATLPAQVRGNLRLEIAWTAVPLITVLVLFGLTLRSLATVTATDTSPDGVRLDVTAYRWGWTFRYPDDGVTVSSQPGSVPEVVLPVGTTIHVSLSSTDVVHAFYVPTFLFKRDAIPGRVSTFDLKVVAPGNYGGECAEYCGVFHDAMPFEIRGVSAADFQAWLASQVRGSAGP
jgi:cytochrome c oxidase subunit 2